MMNSVTLIGRLGADPDVNYLESGIAVAKFTLATSEQWKDKSSGEKKEETQWHNIVLWRGLAEVAEKYLRKGALVCIVGKITYRSWEKDGVTKYFTEIVGNEMKMLSKFEGEAAQDTRGQGHDPAPQEEDDLPF